MTSMQQVQLPLDGNEGPPCTRTAVRRTNARKQPRAIDVAARMVPSQVANDPPEGIPGANTQRPMLLTVRDVEAELQLGRTRTYELLHTGEIPVIRVGRALRVSREALGDWIAERSACAPGASAQGVSRTRCYR